jgi:hypothetical protein
MLAAKLIHSDTRAQALRHEPTLVAWFAGEVITQQMSRPPLPVFLACRAGLVASSFVVKSSVSEGWCVEATMKSWRQDAWSHGITITYEGEMVGGQA